MLTLLAMTLGLLSHTSVADTTQLRDKSPHFGEDGFDIRLGAGVISWDSPFYVGEDDTGSAAVPLLDLTYQRDRFYFALNDVDGLVAGYTLYKNQQWILDAGFSPAIWGYDFSDTNQLKHLNKRDTDGFLGLRLNHYGKQDRLSFSIGKDVLGAHDGWAAEATYFKEWQLRNWLFTGSAGLAYIGNKAVNHMVGVSADEATHKFPAYSAKAGYAARLGLKAEYPLTEHWVLSANSGIQTISKAYTDSPIVQSDAEHSQFLLFGVQYQF